MLKKQGYWYSQSLWPSCLSCRNYSVPFRFVWSIFWLQLNVVYEDNKFSLWAAGVSQELLLCCFPEHRSSLPAQGSVSLLKPEGLFNCPLCLCTEGRFHSGLPEFQASSFPNRLLKSTFDLRFQCNFSFHQMQCIIGHWETFRALS